MFCSYRFPRALVVDPLVPANEQVFSTVHNNKMPRQGPFPEAAAKGHPPFVMSLGAPGSHEKQ